MKNWRNTLKSLLIAGMFFGVYGLGLLMITALVLVIYFGYLAFGDYEAWMILPGISILAIAFAIFPKIDRYKPPNPQLDHRDRSLLDEIAKVGSVMGQEPPAEVYLSNSPTISMTVRGGIGGIGSRRIMILGVPLLAGLSLPQFRSVMAHEFGHYHKGHTSLRPWIYGASRAAIRAIDELEDHDVVRAPFILYWRMFERISRTFARRQEIEADIVSAGAFGRSQFVESLKCSNSMISAYSKYWDDFVIPAIRLGFRPQLIPGFTFYQQSESVQAEMAEALRHTIAHQAQEMYDSHPPLRQRIEAVEKLDVPDLPDSDESPIDLVDDLDVLEFRLFRFLLGDFVEQLTPASWEDIGKQIAELKLRTAAEKHGMTFEGISLHEIPAMVKDPFLLLEKAQPDVRKMVSDLAAANRAEETLTTGLGMTLLEDGWEPEMLPGHEISLRNGETRIEPSVEVRRLFSGEMDGDSWRATCASVGIANLTMPSFAKLSAEYWKEDDEDLIDEEEA